MVAVDWRYVGILAFEVLVTALAIYGIKRARKIRILIPRIAGVVLCGSVGLLGSLAMVLSLAFSGCSTSSALIYSPSGSFAARTNDFDGGAIGGDTTVTLHWAHGLRSQTIYGGGWKSVRPSDIEWKSETELTIHYDAYVPLTWPCTSTPRVKVTCVSR